MITPEQSRAARGLLDWTQARLAREARVGVSTLIDFESRRRNPLRNNLAAIQHALEAAGVEFTNGDRPGVRMQSRPAPVRGAERAMAIVEKAAAPRAKARKGSTRTSRKRR